MTGSSSGYQPGTALPFFELKKQHERISGEINEAVASVMKRGSFILGEEVDRFEGEFAGYLGAKHAVGVASGTDALRLSLMALDIGRGDEVITVPNTAVPTVSAIVQTGATPVFIDIDPDTFNMDVSKLEKAISAATKAVIPVHLYGNAADMAPLMEIAGAENIAVIEDACQAHGTEYRGKKAGTFGILGAFSFYPTKNLGALGDGGMVVTDDDNLASRIRSLRMYGISGKRGGIYEEHGINSRLDELQAAILRVKLKYLDRWNELRRRNAGIYNGMLPREYLKLPGETGNSRCIYHQYVVRTGKRDELRRYLDSRGIGTAIHYPVPVHLQPAYSYLNYTKCAFPEAEKCAGEIFSLPVFPELGEEQVKQVSAAAADFFQRQKIRE